jgi:hypothetical protein
VGHGIKHPNSFVRVFEWSIDDHPIPRKDPEDNGERNLWFVLHGIRPMDSSSTYTYKLYQGPTQTDPILNTYKRDPTLEDIRQEFGYKVIYRGIYIIYAIGNFFARILGLKFLKKYFS